MIDVRAGQIWRDYHNKKQLLVVLRVFPGAGVARLIRCDKRGGPIGRVTVAKLANWRSNFKFVAEGARP